LGCSAGEAKAREAAIEALGILGLEGFADEPVADLPYGSQKRVELARAMVGKPKLLLLDEPTAGMTTTEKQELTEQVKVLNADHGVSVVMIEHDMGVVMKMSHRIMVLDFGKKIAEGSPVEVTENPTVRKAYLGEEA
jgi:branched-chain amino acid transport system ATP-binding protein